MKIKYIDKSLPKIGYESPGACGIDLYAREDTEFDLCETKLVPLNVVVSIPEGYCGKLYARSSLYKKTGLMLINSVGIIDNDYCGDGDELKAQLFNLGEPTSIKAGQRICQLVVSKIDKPDLVEVETMESADRGGFGSTDK